MATESPAPARPATTAPTVAAPPTATASAPSAPDGDALQRGQEMLLLLKRRVAPALESRSPASAACCALAAFALSAALLLLLRPAMVLRSKEASYDERRRIHLPSLLAWSAAASIATVAIGAATAP